jgi:alkylation response protein AidB-like acyl-CoA dehydrogenase
MPLTQYEPAQLLERHLGDPLDAGAVVSFDSAVSLDEAESYPAEAVSALNEWGLPAYYVPSAFGGKMESFEELLHLVRAVSRRDLTLAVAHGGAFLGSIPVWVAGEAAQQSRLAELVMGGGQVSLGLTEQKHGADLLAGGVAARREGDAYRLGGEKWLIGNATRASAVTLLARTSEDGGARGFSLLLVYKDACAEGRCAPLPKLRTHGIRGADVSGLNFEGCVVPASSLVGEAGGGIEITLKALQVTRTLCAGFSLGAFDSALRATLDFALARRLYRGTVLDIPYPREILLECFLDLLACDCVATAGARALQTVPERTSSWSSVVKVFVPTTTEDSVRRLSTVLGARFYLREGHWGGVFQKLLRDNAVVSLFDGSTAVNLEVIALQLPRLLREGARPEHGEADYADKTFDIGEAVPPIRFGAFELTGRASCAAVGSLGRVADSLARTMPELPEDLGAALTSLLDSLRERVARLREEVRSESGVERASGRPSAKRFRQAQSYCTLHAAAVCLNVWLHSRRHLEGFFRDGAWVVLCVRRLLGEDSPSLPAASLRRWQEESLSEMLRLQDESLSFSIVPVKLPTRRDGESPAAGRMGKESAVHGANASLILCGGAAGRDAAADGASGVGE